MSAVTEKDHVAKYCFPITNIKEDKDYDQVKVNQRGYSEVSASPKFTKCFPERAFL